ncbi:MAG: amidohydrolase/deacetylase family metallohydrolase, partial [Daejeonella sp.]|nr:amidohydrolase/deacetylase family metallohydrolase [Daejeonella sp.]
RGGHVIDKKNKINELMDVAIQNGKIAAIAKNINPGLAIQVVDAKGMYVSPGFIDLHTHVFAGTEVNRALSNGDTAVAPDGFTFRSGVTTVVDCGDAGWKSFPTFKRNIIDKSKTRVLSFLNIVGEGMRGRADYEQDINDMDAKMAANTALEYKDYIVGFKLAHFNTFSWVPVQRVVEAGKLADMPVIIDLGYRLPLEELFFKYLRPGDIYTHVFTEAARREPVTDIKTKQLRPFIIPAQKRGILFDVGFGGASFNFNQAIIAIKSGFLPNTISTDLHTGSMNAGMKDQVNVLSTLLAIGMDIPSVIARSTWAPAQAIKREELGNLSVGAIADVTVLSIRTGKFGFRDADGNRIEGKQRLECEMTIKGGKVVYELNSITANNP